MSISMYTGIDWGLSRWVVTKFALAPGCHAERSEGSGSAGTEMLRFAQHDKRASGGFSSEIEIRRCSFMRKHVYPLVVLECTLSAYCEGTERTLQVQKKIPGPR